MFQRDAILKSDWYDKRIKAKQAVDIKLWQRHIFYLTEYCTRATHSTVIERLNLQERLKDAHDKLSICTSSDYLQNLYGTIGVDPALS